MKTIIAGSRSITSKEKVFLVIRLSQFNITEVVSGTARGVDSLGEAWAIENNILIRHFPANWNKYGRSAGYRRNVEMADYADALIAIWDGSSRGTANMIEEAKKRGLKTFIYK